MIHICPKYGCKQFKRTTTVQQVLTINNTNENVYIDAIKDAGPWKCIVCGTEAIKATIIDVTLPLYDIETINRNMLRGQSPENRQFLNKTDITKTDCPFTRTSVTLKGGNILKLTLYKEKNNTNVIICAILSITDAASTKTLCQSEPKFAIQPIMEFVCKDTCYRITIFDTKPDNEL